MLERRPDFRADSFPNYFPERYFVANCFRGRENSLQIERVPFQGVYRDVLEDIFVGRLEDDLGCPARLVRLDPAQHVKAPALAGMEALEPHLGARRGKVVAARTAELEKLFGHLHAHQMRHALRAVGRAAAVAEKSGKGRIAAGEQRSAQDVLFFRENRAHTGILSRKGGPGNSARPPSPFPGITAAMEGTTSC